MIFRAAVIVLLLAVCGLLYSAGAKLDKLYYSIPRGDVELSGNVSLIQRDVATLVGASGKTSAQDVDAQSKAKADLMLHQQGKWPGVVYPPSPSP